MTRWSHCQSVTQSWIIPRELTRNSCGEHILWYPVVLKHGGWTFLCYIYIIIYIHILVGGLEHFLMTFHILGMSFFQLSFIFFRGVQTTNQYICIYIYIIIYVHGYITFMNYAPLFKWSVLLLHLLWNFVFFWPRPFWTWVSCHWHTRASHVGYIF